MMTARRVPCDRIAHTGYVVFEGIGKADPVRMRSIRQPLVRRLIAQLLLIFFGLFSAETIIADSCDGDASASAFSVSDPSAPDQSPAPGGSIPTHAMHICHCVHAHGGSLGVTGGSFRPSALPQHVGGESIRTPMSATPEPRLRPPVT